MLSSSCRPVALARRASPLRSPGPGKAFASKAPIDAPQTGAPPGPTRTPSNRGINGPAATNRGPTTARWIRLAHAAAATGERMAE